MIKISVITITFNAEKVLPPTLQSVFRQTYSAVEHWIIDGKSTDSTVTLARQYEQQGAGSGHQVHVLSEPDGGIYDAMNKGLRLATGDYVVFLNAGDRLPSADTLAIVAQTAADAGLPEPAVLYGDTDIVDDEGHFLRHRRLAPPARLSWKSFRKGMLVCHQAFYARTDLAKATPYNLQYRYSADVDWCIRVMKAAARKQLPLCRVHAIVANFLDGGTTTKNHRASLKERFHVMRSHYGLATTLLMHLWFIVRGVAKR